jgi:hypothetical protein
VGDAQPEPAQPSCHVDDAVADRRDVLSGLDAFRLREYSGLEK